MNIYLKDTTDFNNNGLGFLTDVINALITEELNGKYELELEYIRNGKLSEYLDYQNIIKCKVSDGTYQLFRITYVDKTFKTIKILAKHIFYDLLDNFLLDVYPKNLNGQQFLNHLLSHTELETSFTGISNISDTKSARYVRKNPVSSIMGDEANSMVNLFGGELKRDNFTIRFLNRVGNDNGVKLLFGKNITGIDISIDVSNLYTRIMPQGYDALLLPELYVDSPLIDAYPTPKIVKMEFSEIRYDPDETVEDAYHNLEDAYDALREKAEEQFNAGVDKPVINIKVDWIELSKTNEYKQYSNLEKVLLGDTITANILGVDYTTRVITTKYNPIKDMIVNFEIGTLKPTFYDSVNKLESSVEKVNPSSLLAAAQENATQLITSAMGGYVYKTQSELYIMDTNDPTTATKVWRWNLNGLGYSSTGINGPYGLAMTMDGAIVADFITTGHLNTNLIQGYDQLVLSVGDLEAKIDTIADITTSGESELAKVELMNVNASEPILIKIRPINEDISYLYPSTGLYPSDILFAKQRILRFTNTTTHEIIDYELPEDLLICGDKCDEFILSYGDGISKSCYVNKVAEHTSVNGVNSLLSTPRTDTYPFPNIPLDNGNYTVELLGYSSGYLYVQLMASNIYTAEFPTRREVNASIALAKEEINLGVDERFVNYSTTTQMNAAINIKADQIISSVSETYATKETTDSLSTRIGQTAKTIELTASDNQTSCGILIKLKNELGEEIDSTAANITLSGLVKFTDLSGNGTTNINGSNITTGTIDANRVNVINVVAASVAAENITGTTISGKTISGGQISGTNIYGSFISGGSMNINNTFIIDGYGKAYLGTTYGFLSTRSSSHPYVSALNIGYGSGGLVFGSGTSESSSGGYLGSIDIEYGSSMYIDCNGAININHWSNGQHGGNVGICDIVISGTTITGGGGGSMYSNYNCCLTPASTNYYAYVRTTNQSNRIAVSSSGPSSLNVKKNLKSLDNEYDLLYKDIQKVGAYNYDYKYKGVKDNLKKDYGFIIDEIEDTKHLSKYFRNFETKRWIDGETLREKASDEEDLSMYEELNIKEWERDSYIKGLFIMIKTLQHKIDFLEREVIK